MEKHLTRFAWLSIVTAVFTIGLKVAAYHFTGSVGLLSDALESGVNLFTAVFALITLTIAARPPDDDHAYGHSKAEYFSSGVEGGLILLAAVLISLTAVQRLIHPVPLDMLGVGLLVSFVAALSNGITGAVLLRAGKQYRSVTLTANGRHLLTDVWTTLGVLVGLTAVALTGWVWLDAVIAILVAVHIAWAGILILKEAVNGLMDSSLPEAEIAQVRNVLNRYQSEFVQYHALRTRRSGTQRFVTVHIQVPGHWSVQQGHTLLERIEFDLCQNLSPISVITHLEPVEDPVSWADISLNREFA